MYKIKIIWVYAQAGALLQVIWALQLICIVQFNVATLLIELG